MKRLIVIGLSLVILASKPGAFKVVARESVADGAATLAANRVSPDPRVTKLRAYLQSQDSPLAPSAAQFVAEADRFSLDWKLVVAIAGVESSFGRAIPAGSYNGWGWGIFTGCNDGVHFRDWNDGITQVSQGLRHNYLDRGSVTVEQIGRLYAASPVWADKIRHVMAQVDDFSPSKPRLMEVLL